MLKRILISTATLILLFVVNAQTCYTDLIDFTQTGTCVEPAGDIQYGTNNGVIGEYTLTIDGDLTIDGNFVVREEIVEVNGILRVTGNLNIGDNGTFIINAGGDVFVTVNVTVNPGAQTDPTLLTVNGNLEAGGDVVIEDGGTIDGSGNVTDSDNTIETEGTGVDDFTGSGTLPVELAYFQVTNEGTAGVRLNWKTYSELNNEGFEIERSDDGANFYKIGFVEGKGTTNQVQEYNFQDPALVFDYAYYRLKQIDFDGQFEYSDIALATSVDLSFSEFNVYPNPTLGLFNVTYPIQNYSLYDQGGSLLIKSDATTFVYAQDQIQQFLSSATNGIYYLSSLIEGENRVLRIVLDK